MKYILVYFSLISLLSVIVTVRGKKAAQRFAMGGIGNSFCFCLPHLAAV